MALMDEYARVTADMTCPKCGKPDYCLLHRSGRKCICTRMPSGKRMGEAGWLHYVGPGVAKPTTLPKRPKVHLPSSQVQDYLDSGIGSVHDDMYMRLCRMLKLSTAAVWKLGTVYDIERAVLAFPMFNALSGPIGVRFRRSDGRKWSLKGGREGVFLPYAFNPYQPTFIAEGPTDSAALIDAGFANVLGRPNCCGGTAIIQELLRECPATPIVILSDPDEPGVAGAERLVMSLPNPSIVLAGPSDIRQYVTRFSCRSDAREAILKVLEGYSEGEWCEIARNRPGFRFDFSTLVER